MKKKNFKMTLLQCSVCLDDIIADDSTKTSCGHFFHKNCLESWINQFRDQNIDIYTCPLCRSNITKDHPVLYYWDGTNRLKMYCNKDVEIRYYPNSRIKYKIYVNDNGEVESGEFFDSDGINKVPYHELNELNNINCIRNNDLAIIIF